MGNGAVVPLSGESVFVTASEQHDAMENGNGTTTTGGMPAGGRARRDSTASNAVRRPGNIVGHRASSSFSRPRRSRAHQPTLLGLELDEIGVANEMEGDNGAREAVILTGLGIHANTSTPPRRPHPPTTPRRSSSKRQPSAQVVDDDDDDGGEDERQFRIGSDTEDPAGEQRENSFEERHTGSTAAHVDRFDVTHLPTPDDHDERTLFGYDQDYDDDEEVDELDDVEAGLRGSRAVKLPFEAITFREQIWMWTSVAMVLALSSVSLAIAVDWIDWPGDGIGKQR